MWPWQKVQGFLFSNIVSYCFFKGRKKGNESQVSLQQQNNHSSLTSFHLQIIPVLLCSGIYFIYTFLLWNNNNLCPGHSKSKNITLEDNYLAAVMYQKVATLA